LELNGKLFNDRIISVINIGKTEGKKHNTKYFKFSLNDNNSIYVTNLPKNIDEEDIHKYFSVCGSIYSIRLPYNEYTNFHKGFCIIEFDEFDSSEAALKKNNQKFNENIILIKKLKN
jgi:RNA recognition motif-containing protein